MDEEQAENILKNKIMDILEEELAALKFRDKNEVKDEILKDSFQCEKVESIFKEKVFSPNDDTANNTLRDACSCQINEMETENNEDDLPDENIMEQEIKEEPDEQKEEGEYTSGEETVHQLCDNAQEKALEQSHDYKYLKRENFHTVVIPKSFTGEIAKDTKEIYKYQNKQEIIPKNDIFLTDNNLVEGKITQPIFESGNEYISHDEDLFRPPPDHLAQKIMIQTELYFEDYNLFKNSFLLNHVSRNKEGYVSLKLVSSFRKMKVLTRDWRDVAYSVRKSKVLELNPEGNKIRRIEPIPKIEDTRYGKSVMVFNLHVTNLSREYLKDLFGKFGSIVSANIFDSNLLNVDAYHKRCLYFHREIASRIYGIVEFEKYEYAVNSIKDEEGHLPKENEMLVVPLMPQVYKKHRRYLKFLNQCNPNAKREYGRFKPRNQGRYFDKPTSSANSVRSDKMDYNVPRGNFRRPFRGRKQFVPFTAQKYADGQAGSDFIDIRNKKWDENRRLKANNSLNIDRYYTNMYRKKPGNAYVQNPADV